MRRVVVTGMAGFSPIGNDWATIEHALRSRRSGIRRMADWEKYRDLNTRLGAPVEFDRPAHYSRKLVRSMGRVALMSTRATELALEDAGLLNDPRIQDGRMGVSYGSSTGSPDAVADFGNMLLNHASAGINANSYLKMMSHTAAVNIGVFFNLKGRVIPTSSACTSGSQGIGYAYEAIKFGMQDVMVAGGAEELCPTMAAVFDTLYATSTKNATPHLTPRPFDRDRDGLVIGEGAATLVLESYDHARARGATILAEIVGYATNSDGRHITNPTQATMEVAMQSALDNAGLNASDIDFISGHGTATEQGDIAESHATRQILGPTIPFHSLKSYFGHSLGACGSIEAWLGIEMMREGWFAPTVNLDNVDEACADLDYLMGTGREIEVAHLMSNNFAFGGINSSLIFRNGAAL